LQAAAPATVHISSTRDICSYSHILRGNDVGVLCLHHDVLDMHTYLLYGITLFRRPAHKPHAATADSTRNTKLHSTGSPYSIAQLILVLGSQPAGDVSHKPGGKLPLLSTRPAITSTTLKRAATNFAAW